MRNISVENNSGSALAEALAGRMYRLSGTYEVEREKVREFARAIQLTHPAHYRESAAAELGHSGLVAPFTFTAVLGARAQRRMLETIIDDARSGQMLHTEQRILAHRPVRVGDRLSCLIGLESYRSSHGQDRLIFASVIVDRTNTPVQTGWTTAVTSSDASRIDIIGPAAEAIMARGGEYPSADNELLPAEGALSDYRAAVPNEYIPRSTRSFDSVAVGDRLPPRCIRLARGDLVNYAGVSGDPNPLHWSDHIVALAGLDNVVAHGMLTMGSSTEMLTCWAGDPGALREYDVRFTSPVFVPSTMPAELHIAGTVKSLDPEQRTATVTVSAESAGKRVLGRAVATIRLR
ncbi:fused (3R)-hydroxyacyl-ACP dehydratase subunits HadA/HadB [Nocardia paucivorans]|uniref:fused (3R)-hydroxyacyl-ACP dehydratase subunits HadA/HadB n=1 Tax=Nocardia paucivorans TaxID=114259 RepID=UPI000315A01A|nr:fused (3R)-hydroxyacyl-ACP dehydratase subunits HadA/HadB [Nocardia paucivorans]